MKDAPNCLKCKHFVITYQVSHPRACTVFGLKTALMPSHLVFKTTGTHCPAFEQKILPKKS